MPRMSKPLVVPPVVARIVETPEVAAAARALVHAIVDALFNQGEKNE